MKESISKKKKKFLKKNGSLWWRVIEVKFGTMDKSWFSRVGTRSHGMEM